MALPILLADAVNPVLFAAVVVAAGSHQPCAAGLAMILGHTAAYFAVGVAIVYGLADLVARWFSPLPDLVFPETPTTVMLAERTFWEDGRGLHGSRRCL